MVQKFELTISKKNTDFPIIRVQSSESASNFFRQLFATDIEIYESFFIATVNNAMDIVGYAKLSQGSTTATTVDVKFIAKIAIDTLARGVILCHNHPSGNERPSESDKRMTKMIQEGLGLFSVEVVDHIILTEKSFYSFADEGMI